MPANQPDVDVQKQIVYYFHCCIHSLHTAVNSIFNSFKTVLCAPLAIDLSGMTRVQTSVVAMLSNHQQVAIHPLICKYRQNVACLCVCVCLCACYAHNTSSVVAQFLTILSLRRSSLGRFTSHMPFKIRCLANKPINPQVSVSVTGSETKYSQNPQPPHGPKGSFAPGPISCCGCKFAGSDHSTVWSTHLHLELF